MTSSPTLQQALAAIQGGKLDQGERELLQLLRSGGNPEAGRALERVVVMKAFYLTATGAREDARRILVHYLSLFPQSPALLGALESLMSDVPARGDRQPGRLVLGAGTGRSGSTSLAQLLIAQDDSYFSHEHPPRLAWPAPDQRFEFHLRRFRALQRAYAAFGDVSHWWLPRLEAVLAAFPDMRCIILKRDRLETVNSFLEVKGGEGQGAINHWILHDGRFWRRNPWDESYPKYDVANSRQAIGAYWDDYYRRADKLQKAHPEAIRVFPIEHLSSVDGQRELLTFAGFAQPRLINDLAANVGTIKDGENVAPPLFPTPASAA